MKDVAPRLPSGSASAIRYATVSPTVTPVTAGLTRDLVNVTARV